MLRPTVVEGDILDRDEVLRFCGVDILDRDEVLRFCGVWSEDEANHSTSVIARPNTGYHDIKFAQRSLTSQVTSNYAEVYSAPASRTSGRTSKSFSFLSKSTSLYPCFPDTSEDACQTSCFRVPGSVGNDIQHSTPLVPVTESTFDIACLM